MNRVQVFLYIRESNQQLRGLSLLVTGCHTERSLVSYHSSEYSKNKNVIKLIM
jgi:hypothetical protein